MTSTKSVQNTHISTYLREMHGALLDIISVMNEPQRDEVLLKEAGVTLDRALFPLMVGVQRFGPIGVVDLANRTGRDHTTVSRQLAKLESLGLVERQLSSTDRRVRKVVVTPEGKAMNDHFDAARQRLGLAVFDTWEEGELETLARLMIKFAAAIKNPNVASKAVVKEE